VRLKFALFVFVILIAFGFLPPRAAAQNPDTMMPEQNAAKAKQVLADLINALGGPGYTEVRESQCEGHRSQFGHNGEPLLPVLIGFSEYRRYPDKARTEYIGQGHNTILTFLVGIDGLGWSHAGIIITLYNGAQGWTFDRSGVTELPTTAVSDFQEQVKRNIDNLLRLRLKEPGMAIRFSGSDTVDLKPVDWVELTDSEERKFRLAVDRSTHLLVRSIVSTKDKEYDQIDDDTTIYTNYQLKDSVWMPLQISREHNGRRTFQIFYESCRFNPGFPDDLFSKSSLQKHGSEAVLKKK
jgi:outer membrane lipoprotein-sorting protein